MKKKVERRRHMNMNPTQNEVLERIKGLPDAVKETYFAEESATAIGKVMARHSLSPDEGWQLADLVGLVLLNYISLQEFKSELTKRLNGDLQKTEQVYQDTEREVFSPVRQFLEDTRVSQDSKESEVEAMKRLLRENSKTVSIKNLVANLK